MNSKNGLHSISSDKILETILGNKNYLFLCFSENFTIERVNEALERFYGICQSDIIKSGIEIFSNEQKLYELLKDKNHLFSILRNNGYRITIETSPSLGCCVSWTIMCVLSDKNTYKGVILFGYVLNEKEIRQKSAEDRCFGFESMIAHLP